MKKELSRRDFTTLTTAAFGGLMAGSVIGCGGGADKAKDEDKKAKDEHDDHEDHDDEKKDGGEKQASHDPKLLLEEPHVCKGLNACKGNAKGGENMCAGTTACATANAHTCAGQNDCKGQGGCGDYPGQNQCKSQGECGVPLTHADAWKKARQALQGQLPEDKQLAESAPPQAE